MTTAQKSIMNFEGVDIYQLSDVKVMRNMVRLTKWLPANNIEFRFAKNEYLRISKDVTRVCVIVYAEGKVAVFVNDLTGGAFDSMDDEA